MSRPGIRRAAERQEGVVALEAVFLMPAVLAGALMLFEIVRMALIVVIGTLALDTALGTLRLAVTPPLNDKAILQQRVKLGMLAASYGTLDADDFGVQVESYPSLEDFGRGTGGQTSTAKIPIVVIDVKLALDWTTPVPALVGLGGRLHAYLSPGPGQPLRIGGKSAMTRRATTRRTLDRQRGNVALEAVLIFPTLLMVVFIAQDLFLISRTRADLERSVATLSTILASQDSLTAPGLKRLVTDVLKGGDGDYDLVVGQVWRSGQVAWGLAVGSAKGLCANPLKKDAFYAGALPEQDPKDDTKQVALFVVQGCQDSGALGLSQLVLGSGALKALSVNRMRNPDLRLDAELSQQAGLPATGQRLKLTACRSSSRLVRNASPRPRVSHASWNPSFAPEHPSAPSADAAAPGCPRTGP